jgi:hypothetical protein
MSQEDFNMESERSLGFIDINLDSNYFDNLLFFKFSFEELKKVL